MRRIPDYYGEEAPKMKKVTVLFMDEDAALAAAAVRPGGCGAIRRRPMRIR